jgi:hypothetical protein
MNSWNKLYLVLTACFFVALVTASCVMVIPVGTDVWFHFDVAEVWANGQNGMFSERVLTENRFPYPPIFHLLLVPSVWLGQEALMGKLMQVVLPFGIYLTVTWFMRKHTTPKAACLTAMILLATVGFVDGTIQCRPQGLAMMLLPLVFDSFLCGNQLDFFGFNSLVGYIHGIAGLANTWLPSLVGLFNRKMRKGIIASILILVPLAIVTLSYFGGAASKWGSHMDTYQEYLVFSDPFNMIPYYAGVSLIGWAFVVYALLRWNRVGAFEKVLTLSVLGLTVMIPFWADRFLQYAVVGLACLAGKGISENRRLLYILVPLIAVMTVLGLVNIFWVTFTNNWWLYPPT